MDAHALWEEVKENLRKLDGCSLHDFSIDTNPYQKFGKKFQCANCGGTVDWHTKHWYERGLAHGKVQVVN